VKMSTTSETTNRDRASRAVSYHCRRIRSRHPRIATCCPRSDDYSSRPIAPASFGYGRKSDGPAMSIVYYVPDDNDDILVATMGDRAKAKGRRPQRQGQPLRPRRDLAIFLPAGLLRRP